MHILLWRNHCVSRMNWEKKNVICENVRRHIHMQTHNDRNRRIYRHKTRCCERKKEKKNVEKQQHTQKCYGIATGKREMSVYLATSQCSKCQNRIDSNERANETERESKNHNQSIHTNNIGQTNRYYTVNILTLTVRYFACAIVNAWYVHAHEFTHNSWLWVCVRDVVELAWKCCHFKSHTVNEQKSTIVVDLFLL